MNKIISIVGFIVIIFAMSFGFGAGKDVARTFVSPQKQSGDTADHVMNYSDSQIMASAKQMAESVSRTAPVQIDSMTTLLGVIFMPDTKTIIYKYETTSPIDPSKMDSYLVGHTCADRIRKAFMYHGIKFMHLYSTPLGQQTTSVAYHDCQ